MKKLYVIVLAVCFFTIRSSAQVSVNATGGTLNGSYSTLKDAFDAINNGTHQGAIAINIASPGTTETAQAVLNSSGTGSAVYTSVYIRPTSTSVVVTGNLSTSVIKLYGADNITIDGFQAAGSSRDLTISNTSTGTSSAVIWIGSASSTDGAGSNTIKNCIVTGNASTTTLSGIVSSSGTNIGSAAEIANNSNNYTNNVITASRYGISVVGPSTADNSVIISTNTIGSSAAASRIGFKGIFLSNQSGATVDNNTILGISGTDASNSNVTSGITISANSTNGNIYNNKISNVKNTNTGGWTAHGITLTSTSASSGILVYNNFIYDIAGYGWASNRTDNGHGIGIIGGGGYSVYFNSVSLATNQTVAGPTAAIYIGAAASISGLKINNNIFSNQETVGTRYGIYSEKAASVFSSIDNNDYYSNTHVGFLSSNRTTLADWQTATSQDPNSVAVNPVFTSATDLHLQGSSPLNDLGFAVGISTDIDNQTRSVSTPDIGADEFTPPACSSTLGGTVTASVTSICGSGSVSLSSSGYSFGLGIAYQWQISSDNSVFTDISGESNPLSGSSGTFSATRYFRLKVTCNAGAPGYSASVQVTVNNPVVASTTPATRCGVGTVTLSATGPGTLQWYAASTGGSSLGSGTSFTTPTISSTTSFYVSATTGGVSASGGKTSTTGSDGSYNGVAGLVFDAYSAFTLTSVKMYPQAAGTITISAYTSAGVLIPGCTANYTFSGASSTGVVVPLNFSIPTGTSHRLLISTNGVNIWRDFTGNSFPYTLGTLGSITSGYISGTSTTYYFFYDWQVTSSCEGTRTPVTATVTAPPVFTSMNSSASICEGSSVSLNVTSANAYTYTWTPGPLSGPSHTVTPINTTTYTVSATDISGCRRDSTITISVSPAPSAITIVPSSATVCNGDIQKLYVTGGTKTGLFEGFETYPFTKWNFTSNNSGTALTQTSTYYSQGNNSAAISNATTTSSATLDLNSSVDLSTYSNASLSFYHICSSETGFDYGHVEYSTNGGSSWNSFPQSAYSGSGILKNGTISFDKSSYSDWPITLGTGPATSTWKKETISLNSYLVSNFRVRFRMTTDISIAYAGWFIDSVAIIGKSNITWSPFTDLYTNSGATIGYAGTAADTVYYKAGSSRTYTATTAGGCNQNATVNITALAGGQLTAVQSLSSICAGPVTITASLSYPVGSGILYEFYKRTAGVQTTLQSFSSSNTYSGTFAAGDSVFVRFTGSNFPGCYSQKIYSDTIGINPAPTMGITGTNTVCTGVPTILSANASVSPGSISGYQWYIDGGLIGGATSSTHSTDIPGTYTVLVNTAVGCSKLSNGFVVTQPTYNVTSTAGANGSVTPSGITAVGCGNDQTYSIIPNSGYSIIAVFVNGVNMGALTTYTFNNVNEIDSIRAVFGLAGCANPAVASAGTDASICYGTAFTMTGRGSIGGAASSGTWTTSGSGTFSPNGNHGAVTTYTPSTADSTAGFVYLVLTSNIPASPCALASKDTMVLTIKPTPSLSVSGIPGFCPSGTTTLTAISSLSNGTISSYAWSGAGSSSTASIGPTSTAGNYTILVTGSNACTSSQTVSVIAASAPTVSAISGPTTFCTGETATISTNGTAVSGSISSFQWSYSADNTTYTDLPGATASFYTTITEGYYKVKAYNSYGCVSTLSAFHKLDKDNSPMIGVYTVSSSTPASCTNFTRLDSAINNLNRRGIGGTVRFIIDDGFTETAPTGGYTISATGTAANTITFMKSGSGSNPVITAASQTSGSLTDAVIKIKGGDYITIQDLTLQENSSNTVATSGTNTKTEWGIALLYNTNTDGAQYNTIQYNTISLDRTYPDAFGIYSNTQHTSTAVSPLAAAIAVTGANSYNKFYGNNISNVNVGICIVGSNSVTPNVHDIGNDIGGTSSLTQNTITNFGGAFTPNQSGIIGVSNVAIFGIYLNNQDTYNCSFNNLTSSTSVTANIQGIRADYNTNPTTAVLNSINNNTLTLTTTGIITGIVIAGATATTPVTQDINSNLLLNCSVTGSGTQTFSGIINSLWVSNLNVNSNIIRGTTSAATSGAGSFTGISNTGTVSTSININNNQIGTSSGNAVTFSAASTGTVLGITNSGGAVTTALSISNNDIRGIVHNVATTGAQTYIINSFATLSQDISDNTFTNLVANTSGAIIFISNNVALSATGSRTVSNNSIVTGFSRPVTSSAALTGFSCPSALSATGAVITEKNNNFSNITSTGAGSVTLWNSQDGTNATSGPTRTVSGNTFKNITGGSGSINGIFAGFCTSNTVTDNTINNMTGTGAITGITVSTANGVEVKNNAISLLTSTGTGGTVSGIIAGLSTNGAGNIDSNTVRRLSSTGTNSSQIGISLTSGTGSAVNIFNNTIDSIYGSGTGFPAIHGISVSGGTTVKVYRNKLYNFSQTAAIATTSPGVSGITASGGTTVTIYNNFVNDLKAPLANLTDAIRGINVNSVTANTTYNVYYNTVYLNASSTGTNFGTSAFFHSGNPTATTAALDLRNNIFVNTTTANGTGLNVVFRKASTSLANYSTNSNNNLFYAGDSTVTANKIYYDGSTSYATIVAFKTAVSTRETVSIREMPNFLSSTDLHINPLLNSTIESGGQQISGFTDDIDADVRWGNTGYTGSGTATDIGADEFNGLNCAAGLWTGTVSTDWFTTGNWCSNTIPLSTTNVTIPSGRPNYPVITTTGAVARNLSIAGAASVNITGNGFIGIAGTISNSGTFDVTDGGIELIGTSGAQTISGLLLASRSIKNLTISNSSGASTSAGDTLKITGTLKFGNVNNTTFTSGGNVVIASTVTRTANVADITNAGVNSGNAYSGTFIVERYISMAYNGTSRYRKWHLLGVPTNTTQSIKDAWQEGATSFSQNPVPGYGMQITDSRSNWSTQGFDAQSLGGPSVKTFAPEVGATPDTWNGINSTSNSIKTDAGYICYIRGDRLSLSTNSVINATTLRTKGSLYTGNISVNINPNKFQVVGNPYPSSVDLRTMTKTAVVPDIYIWDPYLGGGFGLGGYRTLAWDVVTSNYYPVPSGGTGPYNTLTYNYINSGLAFFTKGAGAGTGTIIFKETDKSSVSDLATLTGNQSQTLRINLYAPSNADNSLMDGSMVMFNEGYSNGIDYLDAEKLANTNVNAGLRRDGKLLAIERRKNIRNNDTLYMNMSGLRAQEYSWQIEPNNIDNPARKAWLVDNYLKTRTELNLASINNISFSVENVLGSNAADRFYIVFKQGNSGFAAISINAEPKADGNIKIEWKMENESGINSYELERSTDNSHFTKISNRLAGSQLAGEEGYAYNDPRIPGTDIYYRVKAISSNAENLYSPVVKIVNEKSIPSISVYPNPVADHNLQIRFTGQEKGSHQLQLINANGQIVYRSSIILNNPDQFEKINLDKTLSSGIYQLNILNPSGEKSTIKVMVE